MLKLNEFQIISGCSVKVYYARLTSFLFSFSIFLFFGSLDKFKMVFAMPPKCLSNLCENIYILRIFSSYVPSPDGQRNFIACYFSDEFLCGWGTKYLYVIGICIDKVRYLKWKISTVFGISESDWPKSTVIRVLMPEFQFSLFLDIFWKLANMAHFVYYRWSRMLLGY